MRKRLLLTIALIGLIKISFASAFIGESADLNLYNKIDSGVIKIKTQLMQNELRGSSTQINNILQKNGSPRYLEEGNDFEISEIYLITGGSVTPIFKHLKNIYLEKNKIDTSKLSEISNTILDWYSNKSIKLERNISNMNEIGSSGLYYDGDTQNSGYDIMYDIEQINNAIFSKDIPYNGKENVNKAKLDFSNLINNPTIDQNPENILTQNPDLFSDNNPKNNILPLGKSLGSEVVSGIGNNNVASTNCLTGNLLNKTSYTGKALSLDNSLMNDLNNQLVNGNSSNSSVGGQTTQDTGSNTYNNGLGNGSSLSDSFPCSDIFCIQIDFIMYSQNLLGGGKSKSIEGILEKNYKIADKTAATPLVQSELSKTNFSLSILKSLKLSKMLHLGVVVSSLPLPILSLDKGEKTSPTDAGVKPDFTDEQLYTNTFGRYGLKYKSQNDLSQDNIDSALNNCTKLTTVECQKKIQKISSVIDPKPEVDMIITNSLKNDYLGSFNKDLLTLVSYSQQLASKIDTLTKMTIKTKDEK